MDATHEPLAPMSETRRFEIADRAMRETLPMAWAQFGDGAITYDELMMRLLEAHHALVSWHYVLEQQSID
jgi:hypothetical protein